MQAAETAAEKPVKKPPQQETVVGKLEIKIVEKPAKIEDNKKIDSGTSSSSSSKQTSSSDKFSEECPIKMEKLEKSVKTLAPTKSVKQSPIKPSSPSKNATRTPANEKSPIKR